MFYWVPLLVKATGAVYKAEKVFAYILFFVASDLEGK